MVKHDGHSRVQVQDKYLMEIKGYLRVHNNGYSKCTRWWIKDNQYSRLEHSPGSLYALREESPAETVQPGRPAHLLFHCHGGLLWKDIKQLMMWRVFTAVQLLRCLQYLGKYLFFGEKVDPIKCLNYCRSSSGNDQQSKRRYKCTGDQRAEKDDKEKAKVKDACKANSTKPLSTICDTKWQCWSSVIL